VLFVAYDNLLASYLTVSEPAANSISTTFLTGKSPEVVSRVIAVSLVHPGNVVATPTANILQKRLASPVMISFHTSVDGRTHSNPR
jgi:hypothetical protein